MLKDFVLFVKYPYTAGIIAVIWIGSSILFAIDTSLPVVQILLINCVVTYLIALIGFRGSKQ